MGTSTGVAPGDWVHTPWPGIWQVFRVEEGFFETRWDLSEPKVRSLRTLVFSRRLVGATGRKSFDTRVCDASLVTRLADEESESLQTLLREQPALATAFDAYGPEPVDLIANVAFSLPADFPFERFAAQCEELLTGTIDAGLPYDAVLELLERTDLGNYIGDLPQTARLQLVCPDHLLRADEFIYNAFRVLDF